MDSHADLLRAFGLNELDVIAIYLGGSRLFGCAREASDWDWRVVVRSARTESSVLDISERTVGHRVYNVTIYTRDEFVQRLQEHEINVVMCIFSPTSMKWEQESFQWQLDAQVLRDSLFRKSNSLFNRAKVYFVSEGDHVAGKKVGGLSLRFLIYGLQLLKEGRITDFHAPNALARRVQESPHMDWEAFRAEFRPLKHELMAQYPPAAPYHNKDQLTLLEARHPGAFRGATEKQMIRALLEGKRDQVNDVHMVAMWDSMGVWLSELTHHEDKAVQRIVGARAHTDDAPLEWMRRHVSLKDAKRVYSIFSLETRKEDESNQ